MAEFDTIIKGGTVFDGTRKSRFMGDIGIKDGLIAKIDRDCELDPATATDVIDAKGLNVCPGFVDLHTHYDAQINWDPYATLSGWHGVTSIVIGNCGFGFAPIAPELQERAMLMMSRVEAIPFESMKEGMKWEWETFPEWLDFLDRAPLGVNVLSYVPISPIMITVMGLEEAKKRNPTEEETAEMCRLLEEGLDAGGVGWSAQRLGEGYQSVQRDYDGTPMVTDTMSDELCVSFAEVLKKRGSGHIQLTQARGLKFIEHLTEVSGAAMIFNAVAVHDRYPGAMRRQVEWLDECNERGNEVWGQAIVIPNDEYFMLEDFNLLDGTEAWRAVTLGDIDERIAAMQDPDKRAALVDEYDTGRSPVVTGPMSAYMVDTVINDENKKYEGMTIVELGEVMGKHPIEAMLDLSISEKLMTTFYHPPFNTNRGYNQEIFESEYTIPGVSDGGAHTKYITVGRYPTDFLSNFVRRGGGMSLEEAHYRLAAMPAKAAGFKDRGTLIEGAPADIVVYDYQNLEVVPEKPVIVHDFPAGEWRRVQYAEGYNYIMVNGVVTFKDGECTGETPGELLRYGQSVRERLAAAAE